MSGHNPYAPPVIYQQPYGQPPPAPYQQPYGQPPYGQPAPYGQPPPAGGFTPVPYGQPAPYQQPPPAGNYGPPPQQWQAPPGQAPAQYMPPTTYSPAPPNPAGRKRALLIGCCYPGSSAALNGCINDVQCIEYCLKNKFHFKEQGTIVLLRDDSRHPDFIPTRFNIMRGIQWLLMDTRPGDSLFFHFSGHGSQKVDNDGDEDDGYDETILPTDFKNAGQITDDELNATLVRPLGHGVTLHCLIDACHSGTALDLGYRTKVDPQGRFYWKGGRGYNKGTAGGTVFQFGACKDSQVAQDTNRMSGSAFTGAATFSFIDAVEKYGTRQTYAMVLSHMMEALRRQSGGASTPGALLGGLSGGLGGLVASFLMGPSTMGGQTPVLCCDKPVDLYATTLML